jgi:hypothetical protein
MTALGKAGASFGNKKTNFNLWMNFTIIEKKYNKS